MSGKRLRLVLQVLLGLGILIFIMVTAKGLSALSAKSKELVDLKLKDRTVAAQLTSLAVAKKDVETYAYFKDVADTVVPADKDQAQAVLDITRLAAESGINIQGITFPNSNLGGGAPSASRQPSSGSTTAQTPTNAKSASASAALSQAKPVDGIPGLYSLQLTIAPEVGTQVPDNRKPTYPKMLEFLRKLENNRRTAQITQVVIKPEGDETNLTPYIDFTLIINIFLKP